MPNPNVIHKTAFRRPQENFRASGYPHSTPEDDFVYAFARVYQQNFRQIHSGTTREPTLFVREVPVHGFGIADLLVLSQKRGSMCSPVSTVGAFEAKLSDWRRGLMQAHRYRYFAQVAVLVVPRAKLKNIESNLRLFQSLRVGLWGFDRKTRTIVNLYTPRPRCQQIAKYHALAIETAVRAASL